MQDISLETFILLNPHFRTIYLILVSGNEISRWFLQHKAKMLATLSSTIFRFFSANHSSPPTHTHKSKRNLRQRIQPKQKISMEKLTQRS